METKTTPVISFRKKEIVQQYVAELDKHITALKNGETDEVKEVREFARILHLHPVHLSHTIKAVTGKSSCDLFEERLVNVSKELLLTTNLSIAQIAARLTYDPSNFTKFFKQYTGTTPKQFRNSQGG
jgi:AraC family transcriptional regulator, regulatory protein of adaptative response / methylphosphotriester-DNA alkyltransferase methyltransferase